MRIQIRIRIASHRDWDRAEAEADENAEQQNKARREARGAMADCDPSTPRRVLSRGGETDAETDSDSGGDCLGLGASDIVIDWPLRRLAPVDADIRSASVPARIPEAGPRTQVGWARRGPRSRFRPRLNASAELPRYVPPPCDGSSGCPCVGLGLGLNRDRDRARVPDLAPGALGRMGAPGALGPLDAPEGFDCGDVVLVLQLLGDLVIFVVCVFEMPVWTALLLLVLLRTAERAFPAGWMRLVLERGAA